MAIPPEVRILESISGIPAAAWNRLAGDDPFLRHEFLSALHETGCASSGTGWTAQFMTLWRQGTLAGAMPLYLKQHSYGEYVFDWAWADAYRRHGYRYYPKLLSAIPFTPVSGSRLLAGSAEDRGLLIDAALELLRDSGASSFHCLFPPEHQAQELQTRGLMLRHGVQFHWQNRGHDGFEAFLAGMNHAKRKNIRQERRKVVEAGIRFQWLSGKDAGESHWRFFHECYRRTYRAHQSTPYLSLGFFQRIGETMPENILLILALREDKPVAAALNLRNRDTLYGRYWGTREFWPGLHFETCYYQAIEYAITEKLQRVEGGAQGEHKLARGFLPVRTWSAHWLAHPEFSAAIANYLEREAHGISHYIDELDEHSPFKRTETDV